MQHGQSVAVLFSPTAARALNAVGEEIAKAQFANSEKQYFTFTLNTRNYQKQTSECGKVFFTPGRERRNRTSRAATATRLQVGPSATEEGYWHALGTTV